MAQASKENGCIQVVIGIESFNQDRLDYMSKQVKVWQLKKALDALEMSGIDYIGNVLVGFEGESCSDIMAELMTIPKEYTIFPVLVQPFIGTMNAKTRGISEEESLFLKNIFIKYAEQKGKTYIHDKDCIS